MARGVSIESLVKKIVEKNFPSVGDPLAYYKPSHFSEVNINMSSANDVNKQLARDGRNHFISGSSAWGGDDIVAE